MSMVTRMEAYPDDDYALTSSVYSHEAKRYEPIDGHTEKRLEVFVIFTDLPGTSGAVQAAEGLAQQLGAHLRLLMPYQVPYALPLEEPAVSVNSWRAKCTMWLLRPRWKWKRKFVCAAKRKAHWPFSCRRIR